MLDVPGIEGSEQKVIDQISNATQKAHAIFYVTKMPNPPQKGEEGKRGTIEKIQKQLDSQTEVWTIFNKPINSPIALKDGLVNESEKGSLKILNKEMKNILGKHYMGYKAVSAQVAFYGLAQALIPGTDFDEKKQKFLEIFKVEELLLYQSHFKPLAKFIAEELLENSHAKIIQSNCNKALKVVEQLQNTIKTTIEKRIDPMIKKTQEYQQEARFNLDRSKEKFISDLEKSALDEIDQFKFDIGEIMEERIEKGIEDEECKEIFKNELIQGIETLRENIKRRFKECGERFDEEIKEYIEQLEERIKDSLAMLERISIDSGNFNTNFNTNFNIDNGIDGFALWGSIGGLALLGIANFWNPIGWVEIGIAGLVALVGVVKGLWNVFNPNYKRSQQRKGVNEKLDEVCKQITEALKSRIESVKKDILEKIEELKAELNGPVENYEYKKERLKEADKRLGYISNDIKTRSMQ
ncbi:hypothetical protein HPHPH42_0858 [Helicobacter pylori Hp H-42]|uniref:G domain-containing protein n=1 Tax=Helicobacter pylori Hp H-42 TaxID=992047 RepID=A0AB33XH43_HELPX|nr:hypothetical protein [Helicobacter pylori]EJB62862.1 hypothetical protein HPHPH42_0858 [Helicobacter pylori Hp H-42]